MWLLLLNLAGLLFQAVAFASPQLEGPAKGCFPEALKGFKPARFFDGQKSALACSRNARIEGHNAVGSDLPMTAYINGGLFRVKFEEWVQLGGEAEQ